MSFNGRVGPLTIATDGLVGCWDAASQHSYPGTGTIWKDISGQGNDATANNAPVFVNQNGGYWNFVATNQYFSYDLYSGFAQIFDNGQAGDTNTFIPDASNDDTIDLGSVEQGWLVGGIIRLKATTAAVWHCEAFLSGDGTLATPFE